MIGRDCACARRRGPALTLASTEPLLGPMARARSVRRQRAPAVALAGAGPRLRSSAHRYLCARRRAPFPTLDGARLLQRSAACACCCAWRRALVLTLVGARLSLRSTAGACSNSRWRVCACSRRRACSCAQWLGGGALALAESGRTASDLAAPCGVVSWRADLGVRSRRVAFLALRSLLAALVALLLSCGSWRAVLAASALATPLSWRATGARKGGALRGGSGLSVCGQAPFGGAPVRDFRGARPRSSAPRACHLAFRASARGCGGDRFVAPSAKERRDGVRRSPRRDSLARKAAR